MLLLELLGAVGLLEAAELLEAVELQPVLSMFAVELPPVLPSRRPRPLFPLLLPPSPPSGPADVSFSLMGAAIVVVDFAAAAVHLRLSLLRIRVSSRRSRRAERERGWDKKRMAVAPPLKRGPR